MMKRNHLLLFALVLLPRSGAAAQEVADFIYLPAARLEAAVRAASVAAPAPLLANTLEQRDDHASIMVRRTESSAPELHEEFDDLYIVEQGAAVLVYGGSYEGGENTQPGEWRGGTISGGQRQALAPGDVVVVPANVAHAVEIAPGGSIIYHVVKVRRGK
jgi:mannose-6-phosphate isomerase-like protein (cupin superfamily)